MPFIVMHLKEKKSSEVFVYVRLRQTPMINLSLKNSTS